jgi:hypothetical protein
MYFIGAITGASGSYSNAQTGASGIGTFIIPRGARSLYLQPNVSGLQFALGVATGATGSTFQTTASGSAQLDGPNLISGPFRCVAGQLDQWPVVAIFNTAGGFVSCRVFASPTG